MNSTNKRLIIFLIIIVTLALAGVLIYSKFEIYERKVSTPPLREARSNNLAVLERWLRAWGYQTRHEKKSNAYHIAEAGENTVMAYAGFCDWENAGSVLVPWIENGGNLILCLDEGNNVSEPLAGFLADRGVQIYDPDDDDEAEPLPEAEAPDFDLWGTCFLLAENTAGSNISAVKDTEGNIRLVHAKIGRGTLTVMGTPVFMYNSRLRNESNARLTWSLTGAQMEHNSTLIIIRDRHTAQGLFGKIAERGNFLPLIVSVLLLIIIGFWMVIPPCGPVYTEKKTSARPLRQRFLAEIYFLKKYDALETYLYIYLSCLKPKLKNSPDENEILSIEQALPRHKDEHGKKPLQYRDLIKTLRKMQNFTEHMENFDYKWSIG